MARIDVKRIQSSSPPSAGTNSAPLMKTGQTTSYRTGDDGDIQAGRDVDFFTLDFLNYFGNTNRFTDTLGGQTYANDIVLDWSTYNVANGEVLGWSRNSFILDKNWNDAIDLSLAHSQGGFSTGWSLPNPLQIMSIVNFGLASDKIGYSPFYVTGINGWTSTVNNSSPTDAYATSPASTNAPVFNFPRANTRPKSMMCRTFNISEL